MIETFVELPAEQKIAITALIVGLVATAAQFIIARVPWLGFLQRYAQEWGLLLAAGALSWFQNAIPDAFGAVAIAGVQLVLAIFAVIGFIRAFAKSRNVKGFTEE